jgi:hypothetical protein
LDLDLMAQIRSLNLNRYWEIYIKSYGSNHFQIRSGTGESETATSPPR